MFISQVIFESDVENRELIEDLMAKKRADAQASGGPLSLEVWWKEDRKSVGFSMVMKWNEKAEFQSWIKASHPEGHKDRPEGATTIRKTLNQFESIE